MRCRSIHRLFVLLAITAIAGGVLFSPSASSQILPPAKRAARVHITEGPELESARNNVAIIRWTSNNPGGTDEHFGVVHYGTDPAHLDQIAKSHIRLNQNHSYTVFRVRVDDLKPQTTYYYTVDSMQATGESDGVKSRVARFTNP
jgi:phosphodiesterase/alkaline phosphatase D-like protein